jgi:hypothetical protein
MRTGCVALAATLALLSCGGHTEPQLASAPPATPKPAKRTQNALFDHGQPEHAKVSCESCHARSLDDVADVEPHSAEPQRPSHAACSGCHSSENYLNVSTSEPLCATCHPANEILDASRKTRVLPFPAQLHQFGVSAFSHRAHTGSDCGFCHAGGAGVAAKSFPAHAECYSCHAHQAGQKFGRCQDCHAATSESLVFSHAAGAAGRDYNFHHSGHTKRRDGAPIACGTCHPPKAEAPKHEGSELSDIALQEPARGQKHQSTCWGTCHIQKEEIRCAKCHVRGVPLPLASD